MKQLNLILLILFLMGTQTMAQAQWKAQKRQLSSVSLTVSPFSESLFGLSQSDIMSMIKDPADRLDMTGFEKSSTFNTAMTGEYVNLKLGFARQIRSGLLAEVEVGITAQTYGELMLDYEINNSGEYEYLSLCYMNNRVGVTGGYKLRTYGRRSSFSFGPSATVAKTFDDVVIFLNGGSQFGDDNTVDARSSTVTNINFEVDYGFRLFDNLALTAGGRYGATYFISSNNSNSLGHNYNLSLGLEYQFFRNRE